MTVHLRDAAYHVKVKPGQERGKRPSQKIWRVGVLELCKLEQAESNTHLNISEPNYWKSNRRKDLRQEKKVTHREAQIQFMWIRHDLYSELHIVHSQIMIVLWEQSLLFKCPVFSKTRVSPSRCQPLRSLSLFKYFLKDEPIPLQLGGLGPCTTNKWFTRQRKELSLSRIILIKHWSNGKDAL